MLDLNLMKVAEVKHEEMIREAQNARLADEASRNGQVAHPKLWQMLKLYLPLRQPEPKAKPVYYGELCQTE